MSGDNSLRESFAQAVNGITIMQSAQRRRLRYVAVIIQADRMAACAITLYESLALNDITVGLAVRGHACQHQ